MRLHGRDGRTPPLSRSKSSQDDLGETGIGAFNRVQSVLDPETVVC